MIAKLSPCMYGGTNNDCDYYNDYYSHNISWLLVIELPEPSDLREGQDTTMTVAEVWITITFPGATYGAVLILTIIYNDMQSPQTYLLYPEILLAGLTSRYLFFGSYMTIA